MAVLQLRTFRETVLYIGSKRRKKNKGDIGYGQFDSFRTVGMYLQEKQHLNSEDRTYGDKHGNQITMLTIKYLIAIYMFSLKKYPKLFKQELEELENFKFLFTNHLEQISDEEDKRVREFQFMADLRDVLHMNQADLLKKFPKDKFYNTEIKSPVLLYLLYFLVSYGSSDALIKDFDKIASISEALFFNKARFILQTSVELYRDDMLLTMLLEPLVNTHTPIRLVEIYNTQLDYYNDLLKKDIEFLSPSISGYDPIVTNNRVRNNLSDKIKLFPNEKVYENVTFPAEVINLNKTDKTKVLRVLIDLFNLETSYRSLIEAIEMDYPHDISLLNPLYQSLENRVSEEKTFPFNFTDKNSFRLMQEASSLSRKTHLVFNQRIIDLLNSLTNYLPDNNHPFALLTRKSD